MNIFDIAELAKVSRKTVQRVLNNAPNVHPATRARVLEIMENHHYEPNAAARKLSSQKAHTIGLFLVQDEKNYTLYTDDLFYGVVIGAVINRCAKRGYNTLVSMHDISDTDPLLSFFKQKSIDGGILLSWSNLQETVDKIKEAGFVLGVFDQNNLTNRLPDVPVPYLDNRKSACKAARYLLDLGHTDIGVIAGDPSLPAAVERVEGVLDALKERGLPVSDCRIYPGDFTEASGAQAVEMWLRDGALPKAIFCSNDTMSYGAMKTLLMHGISVPDEVSLVGYDDLLISEYLHPPLTTMRIPRIEMAVFLADALIDQLEQAECGGQHSPCFEAELVVRGTAKTANNR